MRKRSNLPSLLLITIITFFAIFDSTYSLTYRELSLNELVMRSDAICIGKCVKKDSQFVKNRIETTVSIEATEYLKGNMGKILSITLIGGEIESPLPLTQHVLGTPTFIENEEVLLFLESPEKRRAYMPAEVSPSDSKLINSLGIIGMFQGKYTILTDRLTGTKKIANFNFANLRCLPNDYVRGKIYKALEDSSQSIADAKAEEARKLIQEYIINPQKGTIARKQETLNTEENKQQLETKPDESKTTAKIIASDDTHVSGKLRPAQLTDPKSNLKSKDNIREYFEKLESLDSFKSRIKDIMEN